MESERDRKIRERAYELWIQGGQEHGRSDEHWLRAEQEYAGGRESPAVEGKGPQPPQEQAEGRIGALPRKAAARPEAAAGATRGTRSAPAKPRTGAGKTSPKA